MGKLKKTTNFGAVYENNKRLTSSARGNRSGSDQRRAIESS
jgi:hypothetical protein